MKRDLSTWYGTDHNTYYVDVIGRAWHVVAHEVEIPALPERVKRIPKAAVELTVGLLDDFECGPIEEELDAAGNYTWIVDLSDLKGFDTDERSEAFIARAQSYLDTYEGHYVSMVVRLPRRGEVCGVFRTTPAGTSPVKLDDLPYLRELTNAAFDASSQTT